MADAKWGPRTGGDTAATVALNLPEGVGGPLEDAVVEGGVVGVGHGRDGLGVVLDPAVPLEHCRWNTARGKVARRRDQVVHPAQRPAELIPLDTITTKLIRQCRDRGK